MTELDSDELARYVVARKAWREASAAFFRACDECDPDAAAKAMRVQDTAYRQCERSGAAMGLSPSARVGLLKKDEEPRKNRFSDLMGGG